MIYELKNKYNLNIIFHKKPNNIMSYIYKTLFSNYCHISINLDGFYNLNTTFNGINLTSNEYKNESFNINNDVITLQLTEKEYYDILDCFNFLNNKKYDFFIIFKLLNKYNIIKKNKYICTETLLFILNKLNINLNNILNVDNLYINLINYLNKNNIKYLNLQGI